MRRTLLCVLALAGCDKVFGIKGDLHGIDASIGPDAPEVTVAGHYYQHWYDYDANDKIVLSERDFPPEQITNATASFNVGDQTETTVHVTFTESGFTFLSPAADQRYTLSFDMPLGNRTWNIIGDTPLLVERYISSPNHTPAAMGTKLAFSFSGSARGSNETFATLGSWSIASGAFSTTIDLAAKDSSDQQIGNLANASVYYAASQSTGSYNHITEIGVAQDVSSTDGATTPVKLVLEPVSPATCGTVSLEGAGDTELARNKVVVGGLLPATSQTWEIDAAPSLDYTLIPPFLPLASANSGGVMTVPAMYTNIYGLDHVSTRLATGAVSNGTASTTEIAVPIGACGDPVATIPVNAVQLPINVAVGGSSIAMDNQPFALPGTDTVEIEWQASGGAASGPNPGGYLVFVQQIIDSSHTLNLSETTTTEMHASIPTSVFATNTSYKIEVAATLGFPNAQTGDFRTIATDVVGLGGFVTPTFIIQ